MTQHVFSDAQLTVTIRYRNYKGLIVERRIIPKHLWFGRSPWHERDQWFLEAHDVTKNAQRSFAVDDILRWVGP